MAANDYNLFISHSWSYSDIYDQLIALLDNKAYFSYRNYSVPKDDPIHSAPNSAALSQAIRNQMGPCHVVVILAGVFATYSSWINKEVDIALNGFASPKPILAIRPWGNLNVSTVVSNAADEMVGWNTDSVVGAIRRLA